MTSNSKKKFNFRQSQILVEKTEDIDGRIKILIAKLNSLHENYFRAAYLILNQILKLRRQQIKSYGQSKLAREKGINLTPHQIAYIFGYKYISPFVMQKIDRGKLKISTALYIIKQGNKFREEKYQNKAVEMYLDGRLNTSQLGFMSAENVLNNIVSNKEIEDADRYSLHMLNNLKHGFGELKNRRNLFKDRNVINQIRLCGERIVQESEDILKFGKNLDKQKDIPQNKNNPYKFLDEENE